MNFVRTLFSVLLTTLILSSNANAATLVIDQTGAPHRSGGYTGGLVYQSFTPSQSNLAGIDVDFYYFAGSLDLRLRVGTGIESTIITNGLSSVLLDMTKSVSSCGHAVSDVACHEFRFTPFTITPNQQLFLELSWDKSGGGAIGAARGDYYKGGKVLCTSCGNTSGGDVAFVSYAISSVPSPASALLLAPALIGFVGLRRKKTK